MKKTILIICLLIMSGCSSNIQNNVTVKNANIYKNTSVFVGVARGCHAGALLSCYEYLDSVREGVANEGFTVVDNIDESKYTLLLDEMDAGSGLDGTSFAVTFFTVGLAPLKQTRFIDSKYQILRTENVLKVYGVDHNTVIPKHDIEIYSYTAQFTWDGYDSMYSGGTAKLMRKILRKEAPPAVIKTTQIAIQKMKDDYVFD